MMAHCEYAVHGLFFRTKIFIRFPKTLFATEDAFEFRKHLLGMVPVPFIYRLRSRAWVNCVSGLQVHAADALW